MTNKEYKKWLTNNKKSKKKLSAVIYVDRKGNVTGVEVVETKF